MGIEAVKAFFKDLGREHQIKEFETSSATVTLAAEAAGVEPGRIAKTLGFKNGDSAVLIVAAGDVKTDNSKFKGHFGFKARMLSPEEVLHFTGHAVGGVCPFALKENVPVYLDASLKRFESVFPACGSSNSAIELSPHDLYTVSMAAGWVDVTQLIQSNGDEKCLKPLKQGQCIGYFSPSSPATVFAPKRHARAKAYLEKKGFELRAGSLTGKTEGYRSGSIKERAEELNALIRDPHVRCIMSTIGGMNSNALLPYIDYDALRKDPKIIVGYSDMTAILLGIYAKTGITTFYGPALVASFGEYEPLVDETFGYFADICMAKANVPHSFPIPVGWTDEFIDWQTQDRVKSVRDNAWVTLSPGKATGRLIGGNLNTMQGIWGSPYMPEIQDGDILFIEDSLKDIATVERSFCMLKLSGIFDRIGGLILGKHELFDDKGTGKTQQDVLLEVLDEKRLPILSEFDACHTHPMLTLPIGAKVTLDADEKSVTVIHDWFNR